MGHEKELALKKWMGMVEEGIKKNYEKHSNSTTRSILCRGGNLGIIIAAFDNINSAALKFYKVKENKSPEEICPDYNVKRKIEYAEESSGSLVIELILRQKNRGQLSLYVSISDGAVSPPMEIGAGEFEFTVPKRELKGALDEIIPLTNNTSQMHIPFLT